MRFTPVDVGNPHAVVEGDLAELPRSAPLLETHPRFPARTNAQVARRIDAGRIEARVWGAQAWGRPTPLAPRRWPSWLPLGGGTATVRFPGGELLVSVSGGRARLTGPAEPAGAGEGEAG